MADTRISGLTALTGAGSADGDLVAVVDVSDPTLAATGTDKKQTIAELAIAMRTRITAGGDASGALSALALATVNGSVGTFGDATHVPRFTVNGKGLITSVSSVAITGGGSPGVLPVGWYDVTNLGAFGLTSLVGDYNPNSTSSGTDNSSALAALIAHVVAAGTTALGTYATFYWPRGNYVFRSPVEWGTASVHNIGCGTPGGFLTFPQSGTALYCGANNMFVFKITSPGTVQQSSATFEKLIIVGDGSHTTNVGGIDIAGCNRVHMQDMGFYGLTWGVQLNEYRAPSSRGPFRGAWSGATTYNVGDVVFGAGTDAQYYAIQATTNNNPATSATFWTASTYNDCAWHSWRNVNAESCTAAGIYIVRANSFYWTHGYLGSCLIGLDIVTMNSSHIEGIKVNAPTSRGFRVGSSTNPGAYENFLQGIFEMDTGLGSNRVACEVRGSGANTSGDGNTIRMKAHLGSGADTNFALTFDANCHNNTYEISWVASNADNAHVITDAGTHNIPIAVYGITKPTQAAW